MTAPNEIVVLISAPLTLLFVLLALHVRRYGAIHWVFAIATSWLAAVAEDFGIGLQPLAIALGSASAMLLRSSRSLAKTAKSASLSTSR